MREQNDKRKGARALENKMVVVGIVKFKYTTLGHGHKLLSLNFSILNNTKRSRVYMDLWYIGGKKDEDKVLATDAHSPHQKIHTKNRPATAARQSVEPSCYPIEEKLFSIGSDHTDSLLLDRRPRPPAGRRAGREW